MILECVQQEIARAYEYSCITWVKNWPMLNEYSHYTFTHNEIILCYVRTQTAVRLLNHGYFIRTEIWEQLRRVERRVQWRTLIDKVGTFISVGNRQDDILRDVRGDVKRRQCRRAYPIHFSLCQSLGHSLPNKSAVYDRYRDKCTEKAFLVDAEVGILE